MGARSAPGRDAPIGQDVGVTAAGDDSDKGKTPCELLGGQPPAGPVYLIEPTASAEVGGRVRLKAGVGAKTQGQPPAGVVKFKCQEQGGGVHGPGDWLPCNGSPEEGTGPVWDATVPEHGEYVFSGPWLSEWQNGLGENPARTHNGPWKLRAEHWIGQTLKTSADIQVTLGNPTVQVHCEGNGALGGLPDVFLISPLAEGEGPTEVDLQWTTENADLPTFDGDPQPVYANVFVHEIVTGSMVACFLEQDASDTLEWDGTPTDEEGNPATGTKVPRGVYYSTAAVRIDVATNGYPCASEYMTLSEMSATPGDYEDDVLPLEVDYTIHDTSDLDASVAHVRVYNCSPANEGFATAIAPTEAPTDLGENSVLVELPALDGCPYYVILSAADDHAELPMPDGERRHAWRPARPVAVELVYSVDAVYPNTDGPIYMSDHNPDEQQRYAATPLLPDGRHCQQEDYAVRLQAQALLTVVDAIPGNDEEQADLPCGGEEVYFRLVDPDSTVLWDPNRDEPGDPGNDNEGTAHIEPMDAVAVRVNVGTEQEPNYIPLAETRLELPAVCSGSNWRLAARTTPEIALTGETFSGTLELWKRVYYEHDAMPVKGSAVTADAPEGQEWVDVYDSSDFEGLSAGAILLIYDSEHHEFGPGIRYTYPGRDGERLFFQPGLRTAIHGKVLEVPVDPEHPEEPYGIVPDGGVGVEAAGYYCGFDPDLVPSGFDPGYIEFAPYPGAQAGLFPKYTVFGDPAPACPPLGYFDHRATPNVIHVVDCDNEFEFRVGGETIRALLRVMIFSGSADPHEFISESELEEICVHEFGHLFDLTDYDDPVAPHKAHRNFVPNDGCVMVYGCPDPPCNNNPDNQIALFGGEEGERPDDPPYWDMQFYLAGDTDPMVVMAP